MKDIDFLPPGYRQQHAKRNVRVWRVVVVVSFVAMLSVASLVQYYRLAYARSCLAQLKIQRKVAENQNAQLTKIQSQLKRFSCDAELFTYLRHPWPRTQVLAALLAPLPDSVTLDQLEIKVDVPSERQRKQSRLRREPNKGEEEGESLLPAQRDLTTLREQMDSARVSIVLCGRTIDPAALHRYLGDLGRCSLFAKAELDSLEGETNGRDLPEGTMLFQAVIVLHPGYGQPGGPTGSVHLARRAATPQETRDQVGHATVGARPTPPLRSGGGESS